MTLRRIYVLVKHMPPDSAVGAVARDGKPHWSLEAILLDTLRMALTGTKERPAKPHPLRPTGPSRRPDSPERRRKLAAARRRARERRAQMAALQEERG